MSRVAEQNGVLLKSDGAADEFLNGDGVYRPAPISNFWPSRPVCASNGGTITTPVANWHGALYEVATKMQLRNCIIEPLSVNSGQLRVAVYQAPGGVIADGVNPIVNLIDDFTFGTNSGGPQSAACNVDLEKGQCMIMTGLTAGSASNTTCWICPVQQVLNTTSAYFRVGSVPYSFSTTITSVNPPPATIDLRDTLGDVDSALLGRCCFCLNFSEVT